LTASDIADVEEELAVLINEQSMPDVPVDDLAVSVDGER
jgi:hypothetical protein